MSDLDDEELEATRKLINKIRKYKVDLTKEQKRKVYTFKKEARRFKTYKRLFR